jgi:hypothetical protein
VTNCTARRWATSHQSLGVVVFFRLSPFGLLFSFIILTCGLDVENPIPPSSPIWTQKSLPEDWPERGIDAHESGGIYLEWEMNSDEDIKAYLIYRANRFDAFDSTGEYEFLARLEADSHSETQYLDITVGTRSRYYYRLKTENKSGEFSIFSDPVTYALLPQIDIGNMIPNGVDEGLNIERKLFWNYDHSIEMEDYVITILTQHDELICRANFQSGNYTDISETWSIPTHIEFQNNQIYKWRIDVGANYQVGIEDTGSESAWASFIYIGN